MIKTLYSFTGQPRIWGDGSIVQMAVNDLGVIDWNETASVSVNPWLVKHCNERGFNLEIVLKRKFREQECHDCGALPGEFHSLGCDAETCPLCGDQVISCRCVKDNDYYDELQRLGGAIPWGGVSVASEAAIEFGFWCKWSLVSPRMHGDAVVTSGWIRCDSSADMGARPDSIRTGMECDWNKTKRRWVKRQTEALHSSEAT